MKLRKIFSFLAVFFILLNLIAYLIIYFKTETNVYGKNYLEKKKSFFITSSVLSYVHPYFGSIDLNNQNYDKNSISIQQKLSNLINFNSNIKKLITTSSKNYLQEREILALEKYKLLSLDDKCIQYFADDNFFPFFAASNIPSDCTPKILEPFKLLTTIIFFPTRSSKS